MKVIVVGGGASGMMAAVAAAGSGASVTLIEHNEKLGKKIYITGKGRCNLTNACTVEELISHTYRGGKFLYSAFYNFDNKAVMKFFENNGCPLKVERGNRVFPVSDHASDVTRALANELTRLRVRILLNTSVISVEKQIVDSVGRITGVHINDKITGRNCFIDADSVIIATGGLSYKTTGSDGTGYEMAGALGHKITPLRPSLTSFNTTGDEHGLLEGLSLRNITLTLKHKERDNTKNGISEDGDNKAVKKNNKKKKPVFSDMGELLFTKKGISGPLVLRASGLTEPGDIENGITAHIDLKPALDKETLDKRILRDFNDNMNKKLSNVLRALYPARLVPVMLRSSGIDGEIFVHDVTAAMRNSIVSVTKDWCFDITCLGGYEEAVITRGGIELKEINPKTMASKITNGLYFAGEIIDADAQTGGFNLQIAWSTGYLAGKSAAKGISG